MKRPAWINEWFSTVVNQSNFNLTKTSLHDSDGWVMKNGAIKHKSGRFFSIVGVEWTNLQGKKLQQPLIMQREVGTLGFLMRQSKGQPELLVQAKIEPGNEGIVQLTPTCQATASNGALVHGGKKPPFWDLLTTSRSRILYASLQSEQGSRFLGKRNLNTLRLTRSIIPDSLTHRWLPTHQIFELLPIDYLINTDARSVLISSPWSLLTNHKPFQKSRSQFAKQLAKSFSSTTAYLDLELFKKQLRLARRVTSKPRVLSLNKLMGWKIDCNKSAFIKGKDFSILHVKVRADSREIPEWDQPLLESAGPGYIELHCGTINKVLHFNFHTYHEPGLYNAVELGPTVMIEPGQKHRKPKTLGIVRVESRQSEEGGRFSHDVNHYKIIDVGEVPKKQKSQNDYWLTLYQVRQLLNEDGWLTNEARSVLSFLLKWL